MSRPAVGLGSISNPSTMGLSPSSHIHTIGDPPILVNLQHKNPAITLMKTTYPGHSSWGPRLSHRLTLLCKGLRYLKPLREQHLRPVIAGDTSAPCAPTQVLQHPWALYTLLPTWTKCTSSIATCKQHQQPTTPLPSQHW
jgi:hypothetical protein